VQSAPRLAAAAAVAAAIIGAGLILHDHPEHGRPASFSLVAGAAFGAILQRTRFCFASAFRDLFLFGDRRMALGLLAALAAGSAGYQVVFGAWIPDPTAGYLPPQAHIAPASWHLLLGGAAFGLGMVLAGGCISGNLYRLGEGLMTAPAALAGAVAGFWAGFACWNILYVEAVATGPVVWLPASLGYAGALALQLAVFAALAALLLELCPAPPPRPPVAPALKGAVRRILVLGWPAPLGGAAVGLLAAFAYLRVAPLGVTSELSRLARLLGGALGVVPERLEGLDTLAGCRPGLSSAVLTLNGIFVLSLVAGSLCASLLAGEFRLRWGRPRSYLLALGGGVLLGFGAMISLGCTVGTLLSGIMAFSLSGWVFFAGLAAGSFAGAGILKRLA
jgi:uncharacterized membrane protein YedE/YeeE